MNNVVVNDIYSASQDFSVLALFSHATWFVKLIVFILIAMSVYSWTVIIAKTIVIVKLNRMKINFKKMFWSSIPLDDLLSKYELSKEPFAHMFVSCYWEFKRSSLENSYQGKKFIIDKIERIAKITLINEHEKLCHGLNFLATVASATPFIGLLGTVWGIIDSFQKIGITKNTSLAAVAPGIAEALFATALALIVTIPAVIAYNKILKNISSYVTDLENFVDEILTIFIKKIENEK